MSDRVDEWVVGSLFEFEGKKLASVAKGTLDLGDMADEAEKQVQAELEVSSQALVAQMTALLGDKVAAVRATSRLVESPACLVVGETDMSQNLARMLAEAGAGDQMPQTKPTLEINPDHMLVRRLADETDEHKQSELAALLFDQALLAEGGKLADPASFVKRMNHLLLELNQ